MEWVNKLWSKVIASATDNFSGKVFLGFTHSIVRHRVHNSPPLFHICSSSIQYSSQIPLLSITNILDSLFVSCLSKCRNSHNVIDLVPSIDVRHHRPSESEGPLRHQWILYWCIPVKQCKLSVITEYLALILGQNCD